MKNLPITLMLIASFSLTGFSNITATDRIARPVMVQTNVMEESASAEIPAALPTKEPYSVEWVYDGENIDGKHNYKAKLAYIHLFGDKDNENIINRRIYEHYRAGLKDYLGRAEDDFSMFSLDTAVSELDGVLFVTTLSHMQLNYPSPANVTSVMYDIGRKTVLSAEECLEKLGYSYDDVLSRVNGYYADRGNISADGITGVYVDDNESLIAVVQLTVRGDDDVVFSALFDIGDNTEVGSFMDLTSLMPEARVTQDTVPPLESEKILQAEGSTILPENEENPADKDPFTPPDVEYIPSFNLIPGVLSDYVGSERYSTWLYEETTQPKNLYTLIQDMQISREELEELYYSTNMYYLYDYSFDLLYGGDEAAVYVYYAVEDYSNDDFAKRKTELLIKDGIKSYVGESEFREWLTSIKVVEKTTYNDVCWSIPEAVYYFDIDRETLERIIADAANSTRDEVVIEEEDENGNVTVLTDRKTAVYDYDLDAIYGEKERIQEAISSKSGYEVDMLIRRS